MHKIDPIKTSGLLVTIALLGSVLAVVNDVPFPALVFFSIAFVSGFLLDRSSLQRAPLMPPLIITLTIAGIILSLIGISSENFFGRVLSVLLIVISAKWVAFKKPRDLLQLFLMNMLLVVAAAVSRWGLDFAFLVLLEAYGSIMGLVFIYAATETREIGTRQAKVLAVWSSLLTLGLIPVTAFLFLIIPRPTGAFFAWSGQAVSKSGFSDRVSPGLVEDIKLDRSPAFRARWLRGPRPGRPLWRGIVYDRYQNGQWERTYRGRPKVPYLKAARRHYDVLLEPSGSKSLFSLGLPLSVISKETRAYLVSGYTVRSPTAIMKRILYRIDAYDPAVYPADLPPDRYLDVPEALGQRLNSLAGKLVQKDALSTARTMVAFLKKEFVYDLSPGEAEGDPVLYFLFKRKRGHCEYFASALVLMLRNAGIPARIVGGYLGGEWNDMGHYYLVRQSDAHTWVEAWIEGRGWVSFDPTPSVASEGGSGLRKGVTAFVDFLRLRWYTWVIDYDLRRQMGLAHRAASFYRSVRSGNYQVDFSLKRGWIRKGVLLLILIGLIIGVFKARSILRNRPRTPGERFVLLLRGHGYEKKAGETLKEFAARISEDDAALGRKSMDFVEKDYLLEYGGSGRKEALEQMLKALGSELKRPESFSLGEAGAPR